MCKTTEGGAKLHHPPLPPKIGLTSKINPEIADRYRSISQRSTFLPNNLYNGEKAGL